MSPSLILSIVFLILPGCTLYGFHLMRRHRFVSKMPVSLPAETARGIMRSSVLLSSLLLVFSLCSLLLILLSFREPTKDLGDLVSRLLIGFCGLSIPSVPLLLLQQRRFLQGLSVDPGDEYDFVVTAGDAVDQAVEELSTEDAEGEEAMAPQGEALERFRLLADRLLLTLEERKPYLDTDFTLEDLARLMGVPKHHIYHCLNSILNVRFTRLRAEYRVRHAKRLIDAGAGSEKSLQTIGLESGFSSRSSFIIAFREVTGQTPRDYLRARGVANS